MIEKLIISALDTDARNLTVSKFSFLQTSACKVRLKFLQLDRNCQRCTSKNRIGTSGSIYM